MTCCDRMDEIIEAGYAVLDPAKHGTDKPLITFADAEKSTLLYSMGIKA